MVVGIDQFLQSLRTQTMCSHCGRSVATRNDLARHLKRGGLDTGCTSENARLVDRGPGFWAAGYLHASKTTQPPDAYIEAAREEGLWPIVAEEVVTLAYGNDEDEQPELAVRDEDGDVVHGILTTTTAAAALPDGFIAPSPLTRFFAYGRESIPQCTNDVEFGILTNYPRECMSTLVNVSGIAGLTLNDVEVEEESVIPDDSVIAFRGERIYWNIVVVE